MIPRNPEYEELDALRTYVWKYDLTRHHRSVIKYAGLYPAVVFDDYQAEKGGYKGKIMIVVWPDGPEYHQVFTFNQWGELEPVEKDSAMMDPEKRLMYRGVRVTNLKKLRELMADPAEIL